LHQKRHYSAAHIFSIVGNIITFPYTSESGGNVADPVRVPEYVVLALAHTASADLLQNFGGKHARHAVAARIHGIIFADLFVCTAFIDKEKFSETNCIVNTTKVNVIGLSLNTQLHPQTRESDEYRFLKGIYLCESTGARSWVTVKTFPTFIQTY